MPEKREYQIKSGAESKIGRSLNHLKAVLKRRPQRGLVIMPYLKQIDGKTVITGLQMRRTSELTMLKEIELAMLYAGDYSDSQIQALVTREEKIKIGAVRKSQRIIEAEERVYSW